MNQSVLDSLPEFQAAKKYWFDRFSEGVEELNLSSNYSKSSVYDRQECVFKLPDHIASKLLQVCRNRYPALYVFLLAGLNVLLSGYTNQKDVVVGGTVYLEDGEQSEYNQWILLRNLLGEDMTFKELLSKVKQTVAEAYEYQFYPLRRVLELLEFDKAGISLYRVFMLLENIHNLECIEEIINSSLNDLTFLFLHVEDGLQGKIIYNSRLFNEETVLKIIESYIYVLEQVLSDIGIRLKDIELVTEGDKEKLFNSFNEPSFFPIKNVPLYLLFEEQAKETPKNIALIYHENMLTYKELNEKSWKIANMLVHEGVKPQSAEDSIVVAIMAERSFEMIAGIFGIWKAGAAYLPIDPSHPMDRVKYMLKDSGAKILLVQKHLKDKVTFEGKILFIEDGEVWSSESIDSGVPSSLNDLAYIIYTSGTTGKPKGVMVEHGSLSATIQWRKAKYGLNQQDRVLQLFSYAFDGFMTSFFTPVISGAAVVLLNESESKDPGALKKNIFEFGVTHFICVPMLYNAILDVITPDEAKTLRIVTLAGDKVSSGVIEKSLEINPELELVNEYGPTESTVVATFHWSIKRDEGVVIGKPVQDTCIHILNKNGKLMPIGAKGELCISSSRLARGYLNKPDLTKEKFTQDPYARYPRMYNTGDMARWLPDGRLEFLGRIDHQVKIVGFRIEPGEIEDRLLRHNNITDAVVVDKEYANGDKYLCAYYVSENELTVTELREHLAEELPDYMIPSYFIHLKYLPRTVIGKIDRKALPEPWGNINTGIEYVAPVNSIEQKLTAIWQEVLGVENIGVNHNFFAMGGNSIRLVQMHAKIENYFPGKVTVTDLFTLTTVKKLADSISQRTNLEKDLKPNTDKELSDLFDGIEEGRMNFEEALKRLDNIEV